MFIEIKGTGFTNKGAELMLHAVLQKTREAIPEALFVMAPNKNNDWLKRAQLGVLLKLWYQRYGIQWGRVAQLVPQKLRRRYGLVNDTEIDVVLDASGFSYRDQGGGKSSIVMASYVKAWKKRGVKVILLPQAMGPFTSPRTRKAFSYVVENADLVFPRDDISYKHVTDLVGDRYNVLQAPDFTNLVSGLLPRDPERFRGRYCLIPNNHMIDKALVQDSNQYPDFCARCIKSFVKFGHKPFILIHEENDIRLAQKIVENAGEQIEIVKETDALIIKGIIGLCNGVISSRFHGLVSALSQSVPALATGWSHKYAMLFQEYGMLDECLAVSINQDNLYRHIEKMINSDSRNEIKKKILRVGEKYKEQSEAMWRRVFAAIAVNEASLIVKN